MDSLGRSALDGVIVDKTYNPETPIRLPEFPEELLKEIFSSISAPKTVRALLLTCKKFSKLLIPELDNLRDNVIKFQNCVPIDLPTKNKRITAREDASFLVSLFTQLLNLNKEQREQLSILFLKTSFDPIKYQIEEAPEQALETLIYEIKEPETAINILKNNLKPLIEIELFPKTDNVGEDSKLHRLIEALSDTSIKKAIFELTQKKFHHLRWKFVAICIALGAGITIAVASINFAFGSRWGHLADSIGLFCGVGLYILFEQLHRRNNRYAICCATD